MLRAQKEVKVAALHQAFQGAELMVIAHQNGLTVAQSTDLRRQMRAAGAYFHVTKNRLARIALQDTPFEQAADLFTGPTAVALSKDPVAAAKVAVGYASRNDRLVILGGSLAGRRLDRQGIEALATLPSLDELRARLLGMIQTPATRIAGVLQAPGAQLARVLSAYAKKDEAA